VIRAALFDFGGVIVEGPFGAFDRYEQEHGLPEGFLRKVNTVDPDHNAWACLERGEIDVDGFGAQFRDESAALGHAVDGREILSLLAGMEGTSRVRPAMVEAVRRCSEQMITGLLTNNFLLGDGEGMGARFADILELFDAVVESSIVGVRKPDPYFYEMACATLSIEPSEAVFLDDLGINLKPARAMGMTTIKVIEPDDAIAELEAVVGFPLS
jgi:putative hydrolase of the HAD superfamily